MTPSVSNHSARTNQAENNEIQEVSSMSPSDRLASMLTQRPWFTMAAGWGGLPIMAHLMTLYWTAHGLHLRLIQAAAVAIMACIVVSLPIDVYLGISRNKDRVRIVAWAAWLFAMLPLGLLFTLGVFGMAPGQGTA
jgi:hypothetical protein